MAPKKKAVKKAPSVGLRGKEKKKYRMLRLGEIIKKGDEHWAFGQGPWSPIFMNVGFKFSPNMNKVRREVVKRRGK